jgi:hypothetical protein
VCAADPSLKGQIERDLADQGKNTDPTKVFLPVPRMRNPLRNTEGKDWHGQPADHSQPHHAGEKHVAHMIEHHADHGDDLQRGPVKHLILFTLFFHAAHLRSILFSSFPAFEPLLAIRRRQSVADARITANRSRLLS